MFEPTIETPQYMVPFYRIEQYFYIYKVVVKVNISKDLQHINKTMNIIEF